MIKALAMIKVLRKSALLLAIICLASGVVFAGDILRVDCDVVGGTHDGSSWANAFSHLQDALDIVDPFNDDEIWVAEGTYVPVADETGNRTPADPRSKTFNFANLYFGAVYGGFIGNGSGGYETEISQRDWENNITILSGDLNGDDDPTKALDDPLRNNSENCFNVAIDLIFMVTLDGFSIIGGNAVITGSPPYEGNDFGGGIYHFSGTLRNCTFSGNKAGYGGAIVVYASDMKISPDIFNCVFENNKATYGGAIYNLGLTDVNIEDSVFTENSADEGGAIHNTAFRLLYWGSPGMSLKNCEFDGNTAVNSGGAIDNYGCYEVRITDSTFINNSAGTIGGGVNNNLTVAPPYLTYASDVIITNCSFDSNSADLGGGIYNSVSDLWDFSLQNCTFSDNTASYGGGMYNSQLPDSAVVTLSTFSGNSATTAGGALWQDNTYVTDTEINNSILWGNSAPTGSEIYLAAGVLNISHCDIEGSGGSGAGWDYALGEDLGGNIDADPEFFDATDPDGVDNIFATFDDGLRITLASPCIDAGDGTALPPDYADLDDDGDTGEAIPYDIIGMYRSMNSSTEMGAYERGQVPGDIDGDGDVDLDDFVILRNTFGTNFPPADLDESGTVDLADFVIFRNAF